MRYQHILLTAVLLFWGTAVNALDSSFPLRGEVHVPVVLMAFPDCPFSIENPNQAFSRLFNQPGYAENGGTGSVADYYRDASFGQLRLVFDVYGPFVSAERSAYYGENTAYSHHKNARTLVVEAFQAAVNDGLNPADYDANADGLIDNVSVIFAGYNEAEGGGEDCIWPHQSSVSGYSSYDGKKLKSYLLTSELRSNQHANMAGIGTYCHEFGHVLGLPDLYNTANNSSADDEQIYTVGRWDLMCSGSYCNGGRTPPLLGAFERFMLGWMTPEQIAEPSVYALPPLETDNKAYLLAASAHNMQALSPSPSEYFLLENRQHLRWDSVKGALPGTGLLLSHISFNKSNWTGNNFNNQLPLGYDIVEAFSDTATTATGFDTYPGTANITSVTPTLNSGQPLDALRLSNIFVRSDGNASFVLGDYAGAGLRFSQDALPALTSTFDGKIISQEEAELTLVGSSLTAPTLTIQVTSGKFDFLVGDEWVRKFTDSIAENGSYARTLRVRYSPNRQRCAETTGLLQAQTSDGQFLGQCSLRGIAPRPVYIFAPDSLRIDEMTADAVFLAWDSVPDTEWYHLTLSRVNFSDGKVLLSEVETRDVYAPSCRAIFTDLQPETRYAVQVQAVEEKGCEPHISPMSDTLFVSFGKNKRQEWQVQRDDDGGYFLILDEPYLMSMCLRIYQPSGALLAEVAVPAYMQKVPIPTEMLRLGEVYLLKLSSKNKLLRNDGWARFLYVK